MPAFFTNLIAKAMGYGLSRAVLKWFLPYIHNELLKENSAYTELVARYTDAAYLNALLASWYPKLPMERDFHVFGRTIRVPVRSVLSPPVFALLMAAAATGEKEALAAARLALSTAYAAVLAGTAPTGGV